VRSDFSGTASVNYRENTDWTAFHFAMRILKKGNDNTGGLACTSLMLPIVKYGAAFWGPFREGQINALDRVHKNAVEFANLTSDWNREMVAEPRKTAARSVLCCVLSVLSYCGVNWLGRLRVTECTGRTV